MNHTCFSEQNKKKIGVFKEECNGIAPSSYVGLRAKMYSLKYEDTEKKAAEGVRK